MEVHKEFIEISVGYFSGIGVSVYPINEICV